jgi:PhnB protein
MAKIINYLTFNGNCREAMNYYAQCFQGEANIMTFAESPMASQTPPNYLDKVMHSNLIIGDFILYASDVMPGQEVNAGDQISLSVDCKSEEEIDSYFDFLAKEGKVTMPLQKTFWGAKFGVLTDKYGIPWMFNFDYPKES